MTQKIKVSEIQKGDKVILEDGETVYVRSVAKGWFSRPSKLIAYSNGKWSCFINTDIVEVERPLVETEESIS